MKTNFHKKILKNGLTVLFEKRDLPIISIAFAVKNGGFNESFEEKGISHFIEHMLYKGTPKRKSKDIAEEIEKNGGHLNGFTSELITAYWCKMPSKYLNVALDVLGDMIKNPLFDEKELEKERLVIFEEIKRIRDNPSSYVLNEFNKTLYSPQNVLDILGTYETLNSINREKLLKKFKEVYTSNNLILCVVGDANFEEIIKFAEENFKYKEGKIYNPDLKIENLEKIEKRKGIDQANLVFSYPVPKFNEKGHYAAQILSVLMAGGMSSRLFNEIREKRNLAYSVNGDSEITKEFAHSFIYVGARKENVEEIKKIILEEFKKVSDNLDVLELEQVKKQIIGNYYLEMEDSQSQMVNLLNFEINGNAEDFYEYEKNIRSVQLEDVKNLAKSAISNYGFFALLPE